MPGIDARAPERTDTSSGELGVTEICADRLPTSASAASTSLLQAVRQLAGRWR